MLHSYFKTVLFLLIYITLIGCSHIDSKVDIEKKHSSDFLYGPFKGDWYGVKQNTSSKDFLSVLEDHYTALVITEVHALNDESFKNGQNLSRLHLNQMPQLTGKALDDLPNVTFLKLENCPKITYKDLFNMKSLKNLYPI